MTDEWNDFGFTAINEDELTAVKALQTTADEVASTAEETQYKLDQLYKAIIPLLNNLKANPDREYILWPNRTEKIEAFENKLFDIYNG